MLGVWTYTLTMYVWASAECVLSADTDTAAASALLHPLIWFLSHFLSAIFSFFHHFFLIFLSLSFDGHQTIPNGFQDFHQCVPPHLHATKACSNTIVQNNEDYKHASDAWFLVPWLQILHSWADICLWLISEWIHYILSQFLTLTGNSVASGNKMHLTYCKSMHQYDASFSTSRSEWYLQGKQRTELLSTTDNVPNMKKSNQIQNYSK